MHFYVGSIHDSDDAIKAVHGLHVVNHEEGLSTVYSINSRTASLSSSASFHKKLLLKSWRPQDEREDVRGARKHTRVAADEGRRGADRLNERYLLDVHVIEHRHEEGDEENNSAFIDHAFEADDRVQTGVPCLQVPFRNDAGSIERLVTRTHTV